MRWILTLLCAAMLVLGGCEDGGDAAQSGSSAEPAATGAKGGSGVQNNPAPVTTASGLKYVDEQLGTGEPIKAGQTARVHYTGWLDEGGKPGKQFDSSRTQNRPFEFRLGAGQVIAGWDEGVAGMQPGGKRRLYIPASLGYGARGAGNVIPPNAALIFDVELLEAR